MPADPVRALVAAGREARACARLASLLLLDHRPVIPASLRAGEDVIVLIHGLFATAGVLRPMRQRIEQVCGAHTATFTYAPGPGVTTIAASLGRLLGALPPDVRVHLVGHSLGGLVARWYVQRIAADPRIVQTIAIGTPFGGARGALLMPGEAGRDIRSGSLVLRELAASAGAANGVPHLSIFGDADTAVPRTTRFSIGDCCVVADCGHNGLLFNPRVADKIAERVIALRRPSGLGGLTASPDDAENAA
jgi:pimeloyl-ACP methyl ester carboxylesterase